jgi:hypothetical protein
MLRATLRRLGLALGLTLAALAAAPPARAFGESERQVLIEAAIVVATKHDAVLFGLAGFKKGQRIDPATEASLGVPAGEGTTATDAALAALQADALAGSPEGAAALVFLSIASAENARLLDVLGEDGEPKAGKVAAPARAARDLGFAAAIALQGRPSRFPLDNALERSVDHYLGELLDLFPFLAQHGLPDPLGAIAEPWSGGPKGKLVERAALLPGDGMRAKVKKDELELSADGQGPVDADVLLDVPIGPSYAAYFTLKLPSKLSSKARRALEGVSAGLKVATDASADPAEEYVVEHQLSPDGWVQSVVRSKTGDLATFPHPTADTGRELVTFFVKNGASLTAGTLLRDESGETLETHVVPTVGELPVLGLFFRNNDKAKILADDLIIFATPVVISEVGSKQ